MTTHHHTSKTCRHCRDEVRQRNRYGDPLGADDNTIRWWRANGLTLYQADRLACRLGHHPADLWPNYWDIPFRGCTTRPNPEEAAA